MFDGMRPLFSLGLSSRSSPYSSVRSAECVGLSHLESHGFLLRRGARNVFAGVALA